MPRFISCREYNRRAFRQGRRSLFLITVLSVIVMGGLISTAYSADLCPGQIYNVTGSTLIAVGDFNGDSKPDLVTANYSFDNVSVLLGDGVGRFGAAKSFGVGANPEGLTVADLNGDNKSDIITVSRLFHQVSVLLNDGSGGFGAATNYKIEWSPQSVAAGDFNSDGKIDVAVASSSYSSITILTGDGTGHLNYSTKTIHTGASYITVGDFNQDGKADLVAGHSGFGYISILLGNGAGGFGAETNIQTGMGPEYVAVGDLNGDGKADLVTTNNINAYPSQIAVVMGNGMGDFSQPTYYVVEMHPNSISIGDFDNDGKADIGVASYFSGVVSILPGDGAGKFGAAINYDAKTAASSLASADFNVDGRLDLAVSYGDPKGSKVKILFNSCNAVPEPSPTPAPGPTYSITGRVVGSNGFTSIRLSGTQGGLYSLDMQGNYIIKNLPAGGTYTVTPSSSSSIYQYTFSPSSKTFTNLSADQTFDFTQTLVTNSISGRVTNAQGVGLAGIDVVLNMGFGGSTQTNSNGNYSFPNLASGLTYRVGAVSQNHMFSPVAHDINNLSGNVTANFTGTPLYNITGRVTDRDGAAMAGVFVSVIGPMSRSTTTDSNGNYLLNSLPAGGNYTMNLSKGNYAFDPPGQTFTNLSGHQTANFTGIPAFSVMGRVARASGEGIGGVTLTLNGTYASGTPYTATTTTYSNGEYILSYLAAGGNYTITPSKTNYTFQPTKLTFNNLSKDQIGNFTGLPISFTLSANSYTAGEASGNAAIVVNRVGSASGEVAVGYATSDNSAFKGCSAITGDASSRCDYGAKVGKLQFAAGEFSKTISIPLVNDGWAEGPESFTISLSNPDGINVGAIPSATITITDDDATTGDNPLEGNEFFVRQHYLDFLDREPEAEGFAYWTSILNGCGADLICLNRVRVEISSRFFIELEFQRTGFYVMRLYKASYGRSPSYTEFISDRGSVQNSPESQRQFASSWVQREAFLTEYPATLTSYEFVARLYDKAGVMDAAVREAARQGLEAGKTRAAILWELVESGSFQTQEYNPAFVRMQYFGYLRREVETGGYTYWMNVLTNLSPNNYQSMICAFVNSGEYQVRFNSTRGKFTELNCNW